MPHLSFNHLISINISAGMEPAPTISRSALMSRFVRWRSLCWSAVVFVCKMPSTFTSVMRLLAAAHAHIPLAFSNIYCIICLYRHSLVRARWAGCCLSVLIPSWSSHACCSTFAFLKIDSAHSMQCQRTYHELEQLMKAEERMYILAIPAGAAVWRCGDEGVLWHHQQRHGCEQDRQHSRRCVDANYISLAPL